MNTKHTPGPWRVISDDFGPVVVESKGYYITSTIDAAGDNYDESTMVYNARLIAAAPELLACLLAVRSADVEGLAHIDIDAAIAKATGGAA